MRDLSVDTAVAGGDGRYSARLEQGWDIWGPQGGYVAGVALRAVAAASAFPRPVGIACHFLRGAQVGPVDVRVDTLRRAKRAESLRVAILQNGVEILEALVWTVANLSGVDHDSGEPPNAQRPEALQPWEDSFPGGEPPFPFWRNLDIHPVSPLPLDWQRRADPRWLYWVRLRRRPSSDDPFVDAVRMLIVADSAMYPAATFAHDEPFPYIAPSLDLVMSFHRSSGSEWLLVDAIAPISEGALVAGNASIWSADGRLAATAMQQMLQRT